MVLCADVPLRSYLLTHHPLYTQHKCFNIELETGHSIYNIFTFTLLLFKPV